MFAHVHDISNATGWYDRKKKDLHNLSQWENVIFECLFPAITIPLARMVPYNNGIKTINWMTIE